MQSKTPSGILLMLSLLGMLTLAFNIPPIKSEPPKIRAAVVDSQGNEYYYLTIWNELNRNWAHYGEIEVNIDYASLYGGITYQDIVAASADLLIVSSAGPGYEYTSEEISAIKRYVEEGHGIIITYYSFWRGHNSKLAPLVGLNETTNLGTLTFDTLSFDLLMKEHQMFERVSNPYVSGIHFMCTPFAGSWAPYITTGQVVARCLAYSGNFQREGIIIVNQGETYRGVYFPHFIEDKYDGSNELDIQVFYNAMLWASAEAPSPALRATLDIAPETLNLKSKGKWITAYIELPKGYNVADINVSSMLLNGTVRAQPKPKAIGHYEDGTPYLMVKFDRAGLIEYIVANVDIRKRCMAAVFTITGQLKDGTLFQGSDIIKILMTPTCGRLTQS